MERTGMWIRLTLYSETSYNRDGKQISLLEPYRFGVFHEVFDKTRFFKMYLSSVFGDSSILENRNIVEMDEDLSVVVEAMFEISESEREIWREAINLVSSKLLGSYFRKVLLARKIGRK